MTTETRFLPELQSVFEEVFISDVVPTMETKASDVEEWDSLSHFELIISVEQHFDIKVTSQETQDLGSVQAICALLDKKLGPSVA